MDWMIFAYFNDSVLRNDISMFKDTCKEHTTILLMSTFTGLLSRELSGGGWWITFVLSHIYSSWWPVTYLTVTRFENSSGEVIKSFAYVKSHILDSGGCNCRESHRPWCHVHTIDHKTWFRTWWQNQRKTIMLLSKNSWQLYISISWKDWQLAQCACCQSVASTAFSRPILTF